MNSPKRLTGGLVALVAILVVAACGSSTPTTAPATTGPTPAATAAPTGAPATTEAPATAAPTAAPSAAPLCDETVAANASSAPVTDDPNAATYEAIEAQVQELRGLAATTAVDRGVLDAAGLCAHLLETFSELNPDDLVKGTETLYKELGLLPQDADLKQLNLDLLTNQVAGLYDENAKKMYVIARDGAIGPEDEFTYAHEFNHALQDQAFNLKEYLGKDRDQTDRRMARLAVAEGDATLLMSLWAQQFLTPADLVKVAGSADPASEAILEKLPAILKDPLLFPYLNGIQLALGAFTNGGFEAVNGLFANPPDSTEQVLHPEKFASREKPVEVAFPKDLATRLGDGWKVSLQDTLGEVLLEVVLRDGGASATNDAAAGWGGDRIALLEGPGGAKAVVMDTAWDTAEDAAEFEAALRPTVDKLKGLGRSPTILRPAENRVVLVSAESPDTMARVANALGLAG